MYSYIVLQNCLPILIKLFIEKWQSLLYPSVGPQNELSSVYELVILNSLKTTTRPVDSFVLLMPNMQLWKLKSSQFLLNSHGNTFSFVVRHCSCRLVMPFPTAALGMGTPCLFFELCTVVTGFGHKVPVVCGPACCLEQP